MWDPGRVPVRAVLPLGRQAGRRWRRLADVPARSSTPHGAAVPPGFPGKVLGQGTGCGNGRNCGVGGARLGPGWLPCPVPGAGHGAAGPRDGSAGCDVGWFHTTRRPVGTGIVTSRVDDGTPDYASFGVVAVPPREWLVEPHVYVKRAYLRFFSNFLGLFRGGSSRASL